MIKLGDRIDPKLLSVLKASLPDKTLKLHETIKIATGIKRRKAKAKHDGRTGREKTA